MWGRTAALLKRWTAALIFRDPARVDGFGGDPIRAVAGPAVRRKLSMWKVVGVVRTGIPIELVEKGNRVQ